MTKEILSAVAIMLTFIAFAPTLFLLLNGKTKPHVLSWIIWGTTTFVVFLAQLAADGGVGAWPIGASGTITIFIALLAYVKRADITTASKITSFLSKKETGYWSSQYTI